MIRHSYSGDEAIDSPKSASSIHNFLPGRKFEHRNMYEVEGPGFLPKTKPGRTVHRWTSANTPDSLDRTGTEPYSQQLDVQNSRKKRRSKSSDRTDENVPPGHSGDQTLAGRRRSAEFAVKLNLHTREFPSRKEPTDIKAEKNKAEDDHQDEKKKTRQIKKKRRIKAKKDNKESAEQKTEISTVLEKRESLTPGLYARGQAAPAVVNKKHKAGRRQQKKLVQDSDAEETKEQDMATKAAVSQTEIRQTKDDVIDQLLANLEKKRKEIEAYKTKVNSVISHLNEDERLLTLQDNTLAGKRKGVVLPPINGSSMAIGKRKSKKLECISIQTSEKVQRSDTIHTVSNDRYEFKLPSINRISAMNYKSQEALGRDALDAHLKRRDASHFPDTPNRQSSAVLPPVYITGTSVANARNHDIAGQEATQGKPCRCLKKVMLPPLTDTVNKRYPRFAAAGAGLPLNHVSPPEPTLPVIHNMVLPPITGLPVPTTKDKRKSKGRYVA